MEQIFGLDGFDLRTRSEQGRWLKLKNLKTGEDSGVELELLGPESAAYDRVLAEITVETAQAQAAQEPSQLTIEAVLLQKSRHASIGARTLAAVTKDWRGVTDAQGQPLPFTPELAVKLYETYPSISEQASNFFFGKANWLRENAENLQSGRPANSGSSGTPPETSVNS